MNIGESWDQSPVTAEGEKIAHEAIATALECGINFFDHADIYCMGKSEEVFGRILKADPKLRDKIILQSKVGIRFPNDANSSGSPARYDFTGTHIIASTERILRRLQVEHIDILLLHRPDPLVEPAEVARAFDLLHASGKVRHFGVSNHTPGQMELLRKYLRQPLVINQLEFSLSQPSLVTEGFSANQPGTGATASLAAGILDYCRLNEVLVQAWSPVGKGKILREIGSDNPEKSLIATLTARLAESKSTTPEAILLAWILMHPAGIQPVYGSIRSKRIRAAAKAGKITLTREEWYSLLAAQRGEHVP